MPRPRKCRRVETTPDYDYFKPRGVPLRNLKEEVLSVEGYEALRLSDLEGLTNDQAARVMKISRHTYGRVLSEARRTVASAIVKGMALRIDGGDFEVLKKAPEPPSETAGDAQSKKEELMEKIAVTSEGPTLDDLVDPRFGRAAGFIVMDPATEAFEYLDNGSSQARSQGAGIAAAESVARAGAKVILTGYVGPKAFTALSAAGIRVVQDLGGIKVRDALKRYADGETKDAAGPNR